VEEGLARSVENGTSQGVQVKRQGDWFISRQGSLTNHSPTKTADDFEMLCKINRGLFVRLIEIMNPVALRWRKQHKQGPIVVTPKPVALAADASHCTCAILHSVPRKRSKLPSV
jgi:hypothetical protein